jgi:hypothetical protein
MGMKFIEASLSCFSNHRPASEGTKGGNPYWYSVDVEGFPRFLGASGSLA